MKTMLYEVFNVVLRASRYKTENDLKGSFQIVYFIFPEGFIKLFYVIFIQTYFFYSKLNIHLDTLDQTSCETMPFYILDVEEETGR